MGYEKLLIVIVVLVIAYYGYKKWKSMQGFTSPSPIKAATKDIGDAQLTQVASGL